MTTRIAIAENFNCARDCQRNDGTWNDARRSARGCKLPGLAPVPFKPQREALYLPTFGSYYQGRYPDRALIGTDCLGVGITESNWQTPPEDPADGCPGAWYRTAFVDSVYPYHRRRTDDGARIPNPRFDQADWLIQDAVMRLEAEEERWHRYIEAERARRWDAEQKKGPTPRGAQRTR